MSTPSFSARTTLAGCCLSMWPDEAVVDRVADQLLQPARERLDQRGRDAQLLVLLLADVTGAVVHGDAHPADVGVIGAAAVPEAPDPDQDAALGHLGGDGLVELERIGRLVAQMAPRDESGGAVLLGEVGDGPHGVADDRHVGTGERDELVVGVDRLGLLVGPDGDGGERRDQEPGIEHPLDDGQHVRMHRDLLEGGAVDEQVVHPHGVHPLEEVVGRHGAEVVLQLEQRLVDLVHQVRLDGVGEDGVAVLGDPREVGLRGRGAG